MPKSSIAKSFGLPTKETWKKFAKEEDHGWNFLGYINATEDMNNVLTIILGTNHDFKSLKKELTSFTNERKSFVGFANKHSP